ncbi:hypothetical protein AN2V17_01780 [Vallitalea sp. AN17-2]|uniref:Uncharacterized protein n=1 Tax=Vallitalea maricola TaxID=3074433 RepID=A0ACB5UES0_9FIRM|nr:hypothetical protein AN2V17_01780 [Vallitalea sp. AN17-2]
MHGLVLSPSVLASEDFGDNINATNIIAKNNPIFPLKFFFITIPPIFLFFKKFYRELLTKLLENYHLSSILYFHYVNKDIF